MHTQKIIILLSALLFLSLAGNLFALGYWLGSGVGQNPVAISAAEETVAPEDTQNIRRIDRDFSSRLPEEDREIIRARMRENRTLMREHKQNLEDAKQAAHEAMNAEPFDQGRLDAALAQEQAARETLQSVMTETRRNMAKELSPEGRRAFSEMEERISRFRNMREEDDGFDREKRRRGFRHLHERRSGGGD
ncbi:MAG: periplasmic heavy metal sensor [Micavibrio sp.]|nr:MAG: periplasmic heavy metal sensor [Micavibrio sp.]